MRKILMGVGAALLLTLATVVPAEAKGGGRSSGSYRTNRSYDTHSYRGERDERSYRDFHGDRSYRDFHGDRSYRDFHGDRSYRYHREERGDRDYFSRYRYFYGYPYFGNR